MNTGIREDVDGRARAIHPGTHEAALVAGTTVRQQAIRAFKTELAATLCLWLGHLPGLWHLLGWGNYWA